MRKIYLPFFILTFALIGCQSDAPMTEYVEFANISEATICENCIPGTSVSYSMPNGNDLVIETPRRVIQIQGKPNQAYDYYVWTGDKTYADDPDLIVNEGVAAVLVTE